jgi:hypothetical protein
MAPPRIWRAEIDSREFQKQQHPPREEVRWVSFCKDRPGGGVPVFDRGNFGRRIKPGDILVFD